MVFETKKQSIGLRLVSIIFIAILAVSLGAQFAGGEGTEANPWQVQTATHLNNIRNYLGTEHINKHFIQTANINLGVAPWNEEEGWVPLGLFANRFMGKYNGNGFTISNLTIDREASLQGLFGYTDSALIEKVRITGGEVTALESIGILIGFARTTTINDCYIAGNLTGSEKVGMVAGNMVGSHIKRSYATGAASASILNSNVGGLVGYQSDNSSITDSYSTADVLGNRANIGGLVGYNLSGTIRRCYATGYVRATNQFQTIGGLVGSHQAGNIINSFWNLETTSQPTSAGGGEGRTTIQMIEQDTFTEWDFDDIWAIGNNEDDTYPYLQAQGNPGMHNYPTKIPPADSYVYVSGHQQISIVWTAPNYGRPTNYRIYRGGVLIGTTGVDGREYQDNGLLLYQRYEYYVRAVYGGDESPPSKTDYSTPVPNGYAGGRGRANEPYRVRTPEQLANMRYNPHSHYVQSERINLELLGNWTPIGGSSAIDRFTGSFDGNDYTISNLNIAGANVFNAGLFGYAGNTSGAVIKNVTLENVTIDARRVIGGLVAIADAGTIIENCRVINVDLTSNDASLFIYMGGLVADARSADIINCAVEGGTIESAGGYIGGLVGYHNEGVVINSYATCNVEGRSSVGGFAGYSRSIIRNSYALGSVTATSTEVGGFIGSCIAGTVINSFSIGRITVPANTTNVGGFVGRTMAATVTDCYWNTQNSGIAQSAAGTGRTTAQMTYPYDANTYIDWDFEEIWTADVQGVVNQGYPYLYWHPINQSPNPHIAVNPIPADRAEDIPVEIDSLGWSYNENILFTNPVGFRVYLNRTGNFGNNDPFVWVPYVQGQTAYAATEIIPESMFYRTAYYWKVVPTTNHPDDRRGDSHPDRRRFISRDGRELPFTRGDAENVPVWRFTTEISPHPTAAREPNPADQALNVSLDLAELSWSYLPLASHSNPVGFRVYFNTSDDFEDDYHWVDYQQNQTRYAISEILPDSLDYGVTYYWKVVPTTNRPEDRGDAETVPVWRFTARQVSPNPQIAVNPEPEHLAQGVSLHLQEVSWGYIAHPGYTAPAGFRVYLNTTGQFGVNAPYEWVEFIENQTRYTCSDILPLPLDPNRTYYWRVVPTTIRPQSLTKHQGRNLINRDNHLFRGDAEEVPTWRFTTGSTDVGAIHELPLVNELHANYPNPFNPSTTISFTVAEDGDVSLEIFNINGSRIVTLIDQGLPQGVHQVVWNGIDDNQRTVSGGVYFVRLKVNRQIIGINKVLMMK